MKKSNICVDIIEETIIVTKAFYKKASIYGTKEYHELRAAMRENSGFTITFKVSDKCTYHNLTFEVMEAYILTQPDRENRLIEFEAVKKLAEAKGGKYPYTKKWFLETYTDYKESGVSVNEIEEQKKIIANEKKKNENNSDAAGVAAAE